MKKILFLMLAASLTLGVGAKKKKTSGNPIFTGWYADPEGAVLDGQYWVFPTFSAPYDKQLFFDAFSSPDLVNWTKHEKDMIHIVMTMAYEQGREQGKDF